MDSSEQEETTNGRSLRLSVNQEKKVSGTDYCDNITSWLAQWKSPTLNKDQENQILALEARNFALEEELLAAKKQLEQNKTMSTVGFDLKAQMDEVIMMRTSQKIRDVSELIRIKQQLEIVTKDRDELQQRVVELLHRGITSSVPSVAPSRRSFGDEVSPSSSPRPSGLRKVSMNSASITAQSLLSTRDYDMVRNAAIRISSSTEHKKGIDISQHSLVNQNNNNSNNNNNNNNSSLKDHAKILLGGPPSQQTNPRTRQMGRYPDEFSDFASDSGASEFISPSSVASNLPGRSRCNSTFSQQPCHGRDDDVAFGVTPSEFEEDCMLSDYGSSVFDTNKSETSTRVSVPFSDFGVAPHKLFEFVSFMGRYFSSPLPVLCTFDYNI